MTCPRQYEDYCFQQNTKVVVSYPPLACSQILNGCYLYHEGRCDLLRKIATAVVELTASSNRN